VLAFVGAVPLDRRGESEVFGIARPDGLEDAVDGGISAMLVINVDRAENVQIAARNPGRH
jgi:hypothetical protein